MPKIIKIIGWILTQSLTVAKISSWNLKSIFEVVERFDFSVLAPYKSIFRDMLLNDSKLGAQNTENKL